jgi:hypothetical protein
MTDGPSRKSAKFGISPNCVTAISFSSPVFKEIQLGTRLHDSRSVPGWKNTAQHTRDGNVARMA